MTREAMLAALPEAGGEWLAVVGVLERLPPEARGPFGEGGFRSPEAAGARIRGLDLLKGLEAEGLATSHGPTGVLYWRRVDEAELRRLVLEVLPANVLYHDEPACVGWLRERLPAAYRGVGLARALASLKAEGLAKEDGKGLWCRSDLQRDALASLEEAGVPRRDPEEALLAVLAEDGKPMTLVDLVAEAEAVFPGTREALLGRRFEERVLADHLVMAEATTVVLERLRDDGWVGTDGHRWVSTGHDEGLMLKMLREELSGEVLRVVRGTNPIAAVAVVKVLGAARFTKLDELEFVATFGRVAREIPADPVGRACNLLEALRVRGLVRAGKEGLATVWSPSWRHLAGCRRRGPPATTSAWCRCSRRGSPS